MHEGGIATPLIVQWPKGIKARGEFRHDPGHVIDFVPTLLDLAGAHVSNTWHGVARPPLPGRSLVPAFAHDGTRQHEFIFFQHEGNRALRMGDWKLVSARENESQLGAVRPGQRPQRDAQPRRAATGPRAADGDAVE